MKESDLKEFPPSQLRALSFRDDILLKLRLSEDYKSAKRPFLLKQILKQIKFDDNDAKFHKSFPKIAIKLKPKEY